MVGALGGDEFLVVRPGVDAAEASLEIARRLVGSIGQCVMIEAVPIAPSVSTGVAWTGAPTDADALIAGADAAMYESKRARTGPVLFADRAQLGRTDRSLGISYFIKIAGNMTAGPIGTSIGPMVSKPNAR